VLVLTECIVGLIGLLALDDVLEGRPARHTWRASLVSISPLALLMAVAIGAGRLLG
jgi:hypothetical protein